MGAPNHYVGTGVGTAILPGVGTALGYQYDVGEQARDDAQGAADAEAARIAAAQAQRDANIAKLRSLFGIGTGAEAQANKGRLDDALNQYYQMVLQQGLAQTERGFGDASRTSRQNLARVGQLGSGLDADAQASNLSDFIRGRQRAISQAAGQKESLSRSLGSQRQNLESSIATGTMANPDFSSLAAQRDSTLAQARSNVAPAAIGSLFNQAGSTYFNGRVQEAQGNQGLAAFGLTGGNQGRIS